MRPFVLSLALAGFWVATAPANPNDIQWNGVSHHAWQDRRPLCPVGGESFEVLFQTLQGDVSSARVHVDDGSASWVTAGVIGTKGPYDIWSAAVPATASNSLTYYIELTDGTDIDFYSAGGMSDTAPTDGGFGLDYTTLEHAPVGATLIDGGAVFKVWAPTRATVNVRGEFNAWGLNNSMTKFGEYFITQVNGAADRDQYKYFFNNSVWNFDARGRGHNPSSNYNTYIEDPFGFSWQIVDFDTPNIEDLVIYQLHVGTFAGRNDPQGSVAFPAGYTDIAARVPHLAELGVNAVLLNPITEFDGDLSAGYNPVSQWAPEWKYGTPDDFKTLVDAFHANGIAVLIDIVWNHFTVGGNLMWNYDGSQSYFDSPHVDTPWGAQADFDDPEVADYFAQSAHLWLEEYKIDGFRMDATDFMNIFPQEAAGWALMQRLNDEVDTRWANKIVIAEQLPDDSFVTRPTSLAGAGFDAQYYDGYTDNVRQELFNSVSGNPNMWNVRNVLDGGGTYLSGKNVVNYIELHDEAWPTNGGQRLAKHFDPVFPHDDAQAQDRLMLGNGLTILAQGIPAFLAGNEWLEDTGFGSDSGSRIDWSKKTTYAHIFRFFQDVIALRTSVDALKADAAIDVFQTNDAINVVAFRRFDDLGNTLVVIANFGNNDLNGYRVGLPSNVPWQEILNNDDPTYGGAGVINPGDIVPEAVFADGFPQSKLLNVPARGLVVLSDGPGTVSVPGDLDGAPTPVALAVFPNPMRGAATVEFRLSEPGRVDLGIFDLQGRRIRTLISGKRQAGSHRVSWDGVTDTGSRAGGGLYFLELRTPSGSSSSKLIVAP